MAASRRGLPRDGGAALARHAGVDNLTHSLMALTLANAGLKRAGRGATATLLIASNIPDIEVLTTLTGGRVAYLAAHRGPSHGPFSLLLALAAAAVVWLIQRVRGREPEGAASFPALAGVAIIGTAGHVAMDFATSYGTRVLSPFVNAWFGVDWLPICDVFLLALLTAGVIAALARPQQCARIAALVLLLTAGDYAIRAAAHSAAMNVAMARQDAAMGGRADTARPGTVFHYFELAHPAAVPAALPTLGSPLRWRLITRAPGGFEVCDIHLLHPGTCERRLSFPDDGGPLVSRATSARLAHVFLDFSRFPAAETIRHGNGDVTVHWYDLRFAERTSNASEGRHRVSPFAVWVRVSPAGAIVGQGLGPG